MSAELNTAAKVIAPAARSTVDPTHQFGLIFRIATATSTTSATGSNDIPKECRGRYWRFLVHGPDASTPVDLQWAWVLDSDGVGGKDTAPTLVYNQTTVTGVGNVGAAQMLLDRQPEHYKCPDNARGVIFIATAATGFFEAHISGEKTGK
jgi:hypothetical protein